MMDTLHKEKAKPTVSARDIAGMLWSEAKRHRGLFVLTLIGSIGIQVTALVSPLYLRQFFNLLVAGSAISGAVHAMIVTIIIIGAISVASWVFRRMQMYGIINFESRAMTDLYGSAFDHLIRHSYQFFSSRFSGTLTRRVSKYAGAFEALMDSIMMEFFPMAIFVVGAIGVLFVRSHMMGIILALWVIAFVAFQIFVARKRQPLRVSRSEADSKLVGVLSDDVSNQNTIALFSGTAHEKNLFAAVVENWRAATMRSWSADEMIWAAQDILIVGINVGLLWGALVLWQRGLFTVGDFVLMQSYLLGLFNQLTSINRNMRRCYDAVADASEMIEIIKMPHEIADVPNAPSLAVSHGQVVFNDVGFSYPNGVSVLKDFDLTVRAGEKIAFVGSSGAGKSTITKLLLRLYDVTEGDILIDQQNIMGVTQDSLRDAIGFVPQEPILFHRTLRENIRYGKRDATDEEVAVAAKLAHCAEFIDSLPEKYETYVGERGVKLSGGERQRVAIARAILKNAPILVLDEATSSLDSESEALIQDALNILMRGKTVMVIAHRLSTIMNMDRIIVVDGGKIVAQGSHEELLRQDGLYKKLWNIQAGGFLEDEE